jgi:Icc-related predicted phosphoesterase
MKIQIKSDLHKETRPHQFRASNPKHKPIMSPDADVLVLAGDITNYIQRFSLHYELMQLDGRPVIYVPGNHEYYMCDLANNVVPEIRAMYEDTHVHVLDRDSVEIDGVEFIGATLWSDLRSPVDALAAKGFLNDFRMPGLTTDWYNKQHQRSVEYLESTLKLLKHCPKRVVVTHHSPSYQSCPERYKGSGMNCCFHTDLGYMMHEDWSPQVWIHGHTHDPCEYQLGNTRVICNPKGYPNEHHGGDDAFNDDLIIEI